MGGIQSTVPQDQRLPDTSEERTCGIQQHFPQMGPTRVRSVESLRPPSLNHQRPTSLHASHRTVPQFLPGSGHSVGRFHPRRPNHSVGDGPQHHSLRPPSVHPTHSVGALPTDETTAHDHSVVAVYPVATRPPFSHPRNPVPSATHTAELGEQPKTSQAATAATAAAHSEPTTASAGGKGPSGFVPDGSTDSCRTDRRSESTFYRNASYTKGTTNSSAPLPFVLQEVPLAPFDGDIREYPRFRDRFLDITEAQPHLEPRHKVVHILQYLRGEPFLMANRLRLTDENYFIVVDRLEERYGDRAALHNALARDLVNLSPLTSTMLSDITRFYDDAFQLITDLRPFMIKEESLQRMLLMDKIRPLKVRLHLLTESSYASDRTINGLLTALGYIVKSGRRGLLSGLDLSGGEPAKDVDMFLPDGDEESEPTSREDKPEGSHHGSDQDPSEPTNHQTAVAVNASTEPRLKERRTCPLCCDGELHLASRCTVYTNVNARLRRIQKLKLCLLCLREGHKAATCPRKTTDTCKICRSGPHNRAVCMTANTRTRASDRRRSPVRTTGSSVDPKRPDQDRRAQKSVNWAGTERVPIATNLRESEAQSSSKSTPKMSRKKKSKKRGAAPSGRDGTSRPLTTSTDESMKQKTAGACGDGRLLPARQGLRRTDSCSKINESPQFDQTARADGSDSSDADDQHELREDEEDSSPESSDSTPLQTQASHHWTARPATDEQLQPYRWQPYYPSDDDVSMPPSAGHCSNPDPSDWEGSSYVACASTIEQTTTLLEGIKVTAENPTTGGSRNVIVFFDSGSTRSFVSTKLANDLNLPRHRPCSVRVNTFGSKLPTTIEGFSTSIVLHSKHRRLQSLAIIASSSIVPSIRTALVEQPELPKLRRGELVPVPIQVTPDILIGQDLTSRFKRRYGPTLPCGFFVVKTIFGPLLGGSGKVSNNVPVATRSSEAATPANISRRPSTITDVKPPSPLLPRNLCRTHDPTNSGGECPEFASDSTSTYSGEEDPDARPPTANQAFSLPVEKNEFSGSTTSTSLYTGRHTLPYRTERPPPPRKHPNPLDNSAPLPPSTIHVTLQAELRKDSSAQTSVGYMPDRSLHASVQQNPAPKNPRKTRLRRRSPTFGRSVLGTKNHQELRKCDTMRSLLDQPRPATSTSVQAVPDHLSPEDHYADATFPGTSIPDVGCVAAGQHIFDHYNRPAAETPSPAHSAGGAEANPNPGPAHSAGEGAKAAEVPGPTNSVGTEQAQEPRSTQNSEPSRSTHSAGGAEANPTFSPAHSAGKGAKAAEVPGPTNSVGTEQAQEPRSIQNSEPSRSTNAATSPGEDESTTDPEKTASSPSNDYYTARTSGSSTSHELEAQATHNTSQQLQAEPTDHYSRPAAEPHGPAHSAGGAEANPTFSPAHSAGKGAKAAEVPNRTYSGGMEQAQHPRSDQKNPPTNNTTEEPCHEHPPCVPTGSRQHPTAAIRRVNPHAQDRYPRPCTASQDAHTMATDRLPVPVIDGFVSKSFAAFLASGKTNASSSVNDDLPPPYQFIGLINHLGVSSSYLPPTLFQPIEPSDNAPLALLTSGQVAQENNILPWNLILGSTLGALPPYWRMVTPDMCLHFHERAHNATSHGTPVCGIGPVGLYLNTGSDRSSCEYEGQRQCLLRFGHIARNTGKCLVLAVYDEYESMTGFDLHHEAITALREKVQLPAAHPIHLVVYRASAFQLQRWLDTFPNVVFGVEYAQITCLLHALQLSDRTSEPYCHAVYLRAFFVDVPLRNLALHSGAPSPFPLEHQEYFQTPTILLKAAEAFQQLTGTPKDVLLEQSANTLNSIYGLNINLPSRAKPSGESCDEFRGRLTTDNLSAQLFLVPGPARRADHTDQSNVLFSPMCAFCDNRHPSTACMTFSTANLRLGRIEKRNLCILCLREGHKAAACPDRTTTSCQHCHRGQHHPALCRSLQQAATAIAPTTAPTTLLTLSLGATHSVAKEPEPTSCDHSVARKPRPPRRSVVTATFPPAINHFRVDQPTEPTKAGPRVASRSAKKRSAAVHTPAQAPSTQPSRPRPKRTTINPSGKQHRVQTSSQAEPLGTCNSKPMKTTSKQRTSRKTNSGSDDSVGDETPLYPHHGEKTEHPSRDKKTYHRSKKPPRALAEASSTPAVAPAEAHQQLATAEDRQAPKRQKRKPKKRRH